MTTRTGHAAHRALGSIALAALLAAGALGVAHAKGGNAGSGGAAENVGGAGTAFTCTAGAVGSAGVNRSGNRLSIAVGMANDTLGSDWVIVVTDNGAPAGALRVAYPGVSWSAMQTVTVAKGQHVVAINATSDGGESCSGTFSVKV